MLLSLVTVSGQPGGTNSWTKPTSGFWEEPFWSLGVLPSSSQSVLITNSGWKAVAIDQSTSINFPGSMTVGSLTIRGASDTVNTLLLNYFGTAVPLTVLNGLTLQDSARIVNFNSALVVQAGTSVVTNSEIIQDGGFVRTTNAPMSLQNSQYHLTNGVFEGGVVRIGLDVLSTFNQYGGTTTIRDLQFGGSLSLSGGGTYSLSGGTANFPAGLGVVSDADNSAEFLQVGGTNYASWLSLLTGLNGPGASYTLNGGLLGASNVSVLAGGNPVTFTQSGGVHMITNALELEGNIRAFSPPNVKSARYVKNNGTLRVRTIVLRTVGTFIQSNGMTLVSSTLSLGGSTIRSNSSLLGGTFGCSNVAYSGIGADFLQAGGSFLVTNMLSFGGDGAPFSGRLPTFTFENGILTASNIEMLANLTIGSSGQAGRISNAGFFKLGGTVRIADANELLGRFILASNSTIDLAGSVSRLSFANSSGESWAGAATLVVTNWNGNLSGGGGSAELLKFGNNQSGLTPAQLNGIRFVNPGGLPAGNYSAAILATGEVVPGPRPALNMMHSSNAMVLSWSGNFQLLTSTNVVGPYAPISGATSPHTVFFDEPHRFFVLRSP